MTGMLTSIFFSSHKAEGLQMSYQLYLHLFHIPMCCLTVNQPFGYSAASVQ